ncbi:MAG: ribonuclease Y [Bacteroidetes bacterium]|nr:ribonuclease Y [Bacteroidota bacterium]
MPNRPYDPQSVASDGENTSPVGEKRKRSRLGRIIAHPVVHIPLFLFGMAVLLAAAVLLTEPIARSVSGQADAASQEIDVRHAAPPSYDPGDPYTISSLDKEAATEKLLERLDRQLKNETGALILKHRQELEQQSQRQAQEIIGMAVQRCAAEHTSEMTVSTVDIPNDEMKGRIIGREGRNIRAFEKATGVDVIVDDTPGVVVVSAFDKVRREIARLSLEKLIQDGRIHPSRIDEIVAETQKEMDAHIRQLGQEACQEVGIAGLHDKLIHFIGRLHFRSSYSQNVLKHSIEVSHLTGLMADQLGLDGTLARRCGFLHDIGKAADHEMEGGHPAVGAELLKRYGEGSEVVHAAAGHHDDIRVDYIYTVLVASADACSAGRPGARRETLEKYIRRLEELETLANGFPGVDQSYAVQAGREIRVIVDSGQVNDREAAKISHDLAKAIEESLTGACREVLHSAPRVQDDGSRAWFAAGVP